MSNNEIKIHFKVGHLFMDVFTSFVRSIEHIQG